MNIETNFAQEIYSNYDALWHLRVMGLLDEKNCHKVLNKASSVAQRSRIALIDTSVAVKHPNLSGTIKTDLALDLFSTRLGAFPYLSADSKLQEQGYNTRTRIAEGLPHSSRLLDELVDRLCHGAPALHNKIWPTTGAEFSSHGTAITGLMAAQPTVVEAGDHTPEIPLPYMGVDPSCEVIPISTSFDPDPEQLIIAFLYAELICANVIVLPRIIPDPMRTLPTLSHFGLPEDDLAHAIMPTPLSDERAEQWAELAELIVKISLQRPVVCAAGNASEASGIYPANLADDHNGIISVGAINAKGFPSSYSDVRNVTVVAPSNDGEVFDVGEIRLDVQNKDFDPDVVPEPNSNDKFSSWDIIATDVPGRFGYADSPYANEPDYGKMREFGSYFCRFGGTSAASALVGGFLSLGWSSGALDQGCDGLGAKAWLLSKCQTVADDNTNAQLPIWSGNASFPGLAQSNSQVDMRF